MKPLFFRIMSAQPAWQMAKGAGLLLLVAAPVGCRPEVALTAASESQAVAEVRTVHPVHGPITRFIALPGNVRPYQEATLYAKVPGYLKTISVDKGDQVRQGALLAEIEVPELLADRARNQAEFEVSEIDFKRLSESQQKSPDLVMPQTVDDARGRRDMARATLERTETLLGFARITAPFSGTITRRMVDPGAFIPAATSGGAQNAAIVTLTDFARVRVQVAVPEVEASHVTVGQPIQLTVEGLPGRTFEGTITRFAYSLDESTRTMLAEIELPNHSLELRPGMYGLVKIGIETKPDALQIPVAALATEKSGSFIFLADEGKARKTRVQPGFTDGVKVEIASGLRAEQSVILLDKRALRDGEPIKASVAQ